MMMMKLCWGLSWSNVGQMREKAQRQIDKKTKKKRQKDKRQRQRPKREFDIVTSGQIRTLAMFYIWVPPLPTKQRG